MGNKQQRKNQHVRRLRQKIKKFEAKGWSTLGLLKELDVTLGKSPRPEHATGAAVDPRLRKFGRKS